MEKNIKNAGNGENGTAFPCLRITWKVGPPKRLGGPPLKCGWVERPKFRSALYSLQQQSQQGIFSISNFLGTGEQLE